MNRRYNLPLRAAAVGATAAIACAMAAMPASAAGDEDVKVVNTETVQVYTSPSGQIQSRRVYEQLALTGKGSVNLQNPISTDGLRNLDGFRGFDIKDGKQITRTTVDGEKHLRSVSDYKGKLPLEISVKYYLNGKLVNPSDVVGKSGAIEVKYTVKNVTGQDQEVSFPDGEGGTVTKTVSVPIPMVGSLTTTLPSSFTNVQSKAANMAGDGKGATKLSFTMTLFPPIGSDTAEFGYTAKIKDGVVPRASISALPVNPLESPTFASAATSYKGGADTGIELTDGATQIDSNLLKLRDGASELLAGLLKLRDGAQQLNAGLAGEAAPGADKLAVGAAQLKGGTDQLFHGTGDLVAGTGKLRSGAADLNDGTAQLKAGAKRLQGGAARLADGSKTAAGGAGQLRDGAGRLSTGLNDLAKGAFDLNDGAAQIADGQKSLLAGLKLLESGVKALPSTVQANLKSHLQYNALLQGMQSVVDGIGDPADVTDPVTGEPATLLGGLNAVKYGLRTPYPQNDCLVALANGTPKMCGAADGVETVSGLLKSAANDDVSRLVAGAGGVYDYVASTSGGLCAPRSPGELLPPVTALTSPHPACAGAAQVAYGLGVDPGVVASLPSGGVKAQSLAAADALAKIYAGIDGLMVPAIEKMKAGLVNPAANPDCAQGAATVDKTDDCGAKQAVAFFKSSIPVLVDGITASIADELLANISVPSKGCDPKAPTLICGASALSQGGDDLLGGTTKLLAGSGELNSGGSTLAEKLGELAAGLNQLDAGAGQLKDGSAQLADGAGQLSDGTGRLVGGVGELDSGAQRLKSGAGQLDDGAGQLADGAQKLAGGLGDAANGSGQLADGLKQAAGGAPQIVDGAQRLSDEGTKKLMDAGKSTAQNYGELYATIEAGAQRAQTEDMAFGAPEGAIGLTAYSYEIQGDDGEGGRNLARGLGGLAVLAAGAGAFALRRRMS